MKWRIFVVPFWLKSYPENRRKFNRGGRKYLSDEAKRIF